MVGVAARPSNSRCGGEETAIERQTGPGGRDLDRPAQLVGGHRTHQHGVRGQELGEARMSRDSRCRFRIDMKSGLATHTECASAIVMSALGEESRRTDTWTITQTLPEKR